MPPERKILGVCAWLSDKFGVSLGGLRLIWVLAFVFGFGSPLLIYLFLWLLKPGEY